MFETNNNWHTKKAGLILFLVGHYFGKATDLGGSLILIVCFNSIL